MRPNLDDTGDVQLRGVQAETGIHTTKQQDGEDIGKISNEGPDLEVDGKLGAERAINGMEEFAAISDASPWRSSSAHGWA